MAEPGTLRGEIERGWARFWALPWKWKGTFIGIAVFGLLIIVSAAAGGGGDDASKASPDKTEQPSADGSKDSPTLKATNTPKPTDTPKATNTSAPTATPTPELTLEQQFAKSYKDNRGFMSHAASDPSVRWVPESGVLEFRKFDKNVLGGGGQSLTITAHSTLVASKAIFSTYPEVRLLQFTLVEEFTSLNTGQRFQSVSAAIMLDRATADTFDYNGMKDVVILDNKRLFCVAPHHFIYLVTYRDIKDTGCLGLPGKDPEPMLLD